MFGLRSKRAIRDRRIGLVFQWRLPVGNHMSFLSAIAVVGLISVGLAATVRVRVGGGGLPRHPERRGSLIFVPHGGEWDSLRTFALEAGPFPVREDPSSDPVVVALVKESMGSANLPGYRYQPEFKPVAIADSEPSRDAGEANPGDLPPLPQPEAVTADPSLRPVLQVTVLTANGIRAVQPPAPPPASLLQGNRYLLNYNPAGRVLRVTSVFSPQEAAGDGAAEEAWLRQVLIEGGGRSGGWASVEISSGS